MKVMRFFLILLLVTLFSGSALAEMRRFTGFSLDLAPGWKAEEVSGPDNLKAVIINHPQKKTMLTIGLEPLNGKSLKEKTEDLAKEVKGESEYLGDGVYLVAFTNQEGVDTFITLVAANEGREYLAAAIIGDPTDPDVQHMLDSIE